MLLTCEVDSHIFPSLNKEGKIVLSPLQVFDSLLPVNHLYTFIWICTEQKSTNLARFISIDCPLALTWQSPCERKTLLLPTDLPSSFSFICISRTGTSSRIGRTGPDVVFTRDRIYCPGTIRDFVSPICTLDGALLSIGIALPARCLMLRKIRFRGSGCPTT